MFYPYPILFLLEILYYRQINNRFDNKERYKMKRVKNSKTKHKSLTRIKKDATFTGQKDKKIGQLLCGDDHNWYERRCSFITDKKKHRGIGVCKYTPEQLYISACEYFSYIETHPYYERRIAGTYYGEPMLVDIPKKRSMSIRGLLLFLEMSHKSWYQHYRDNERYEDVISMIDMTIYTQKFSGAVSGFFNASIISRDLGLKEQTDVTTNGQTIQPNENNIDLTKLGTAELLQLDTLLNSITSKEESI